MTVLHQARTSTVSIARDPEAVYSYLSDLGNWPKWAFFESVVRQHDRWLATSSAGTATITVEPANRLGVLDHVVEPTAGGGSIRVPLRVIGNGDGSEVMLTTFRLPGTSEEAFDADVAAVNHDLAALKSILEEPAPPDGRTR